MRILVVEDELDLNHIICNKLTKEGYNVDACFDGQAALDYLETASYDGVIMDIMIPKKDGMSVLKTIQIAADRAVTAFFDCKVRNAGYCQGTGCRSQ